MNERGVPQYAILSGATVLVIAFEAITSRRGKIPRAANSARDRVILWHDARVSTYPRRRIIVKFLRVSRGESRG